MKQNIFDDPTFFNEYIKFRQNDVGLNNAIEMPTMMGLLKDLKGKRVLDIGCGTGNLSRYIATHGASVVVGIDPSKKMLNVALSRNSNSKNPVKYEQCYVEDYECPEGSYDLIVSSLALHYIKDIKYIFDKVAGWLSPGGLFIFSVEHPIYTAAGPGKWIKNIDNCAYWTVKDYFREGKRNVDWLKKDVIQYHRTIDTIINALIDTGYFILRVVEPRVDQETITQYPNTIEEMNRPSFFFISSCSGNQDERTRQ